MRLDPFSNQSDLENPEKNLSGSYSGYPKISCKHIYLTIRSKLSNHTSYPHIFNGK